ncbi:hypothetical protein FEM48_Zijuj02G0169700 [Ziziphus jujuba var. spinosa]|uniref:Isopenicillin N synthase-like Fe(2+) 2OG dioxygenase domain-containing protein n=1 Tax=Ziziphus jujuba var. spinosa TaxID=714518 RepID=A0A978VWV5_ZIZJJ|nr:hypothetical protein FEM48_Zijuj02G0169700 [Ziziphus jujuba var. spinosa]
MLQYSEHIKKLGQVLFPMISMGLGLPPHYLEDMELLLQDHIGSLQVLHQNQRVDIPPLRGALLVNIGDLLQIYSPNSASPMFKENKNKNSLFQTTSVSSGQIDEYKVYGGRSIGATTISSSSAPFPFYILSSRLLELVPNRVGGGATPSPPKGNPPITYKPPGSPTPPPA